MNMIVDVLDLWHLHGLRHGLNHGYLALLCHGHVDDLVDVLDLWHLHGLRHGLNHGYLALLCHGHVDVLVDVLDLRHLHDLRNCLNHRHLALFCDGDVHDFVDRHNLLHDLGNVRDVFLDNWLLALHSFLYDLGLFDFNLLDLILHHCIDDGLHDLRDLDNFLFDRDLRHVNGLLDHLRPGHLDRKFHRVLHNPFLLPHHGDVHHFLDGLLNDDVDDLFHVIMIIPFLLNHLRHMDDL